MDGIRVTAVLVTYNRVELLKKAVESLWNQSYPLQNIIVVNNNSSDGTKDYLDNTSELISIHLDKNTGGAGGFFRGMEHATTLDTDYIWILDDDAIATENALLEMINASKLIDPDWGFLCSKVLSDDGVVMSLPVVSKKRNDTGYLSWNVYGDDGIISVDKAVFVSFLTKKNIILKHGLPVREMFIWGDDTEYSWRISNFYNCYLVCKSHVVHKRMDAKALSLVHETSAFRMEWYSYLYRNTFYNVRKHGTKKDIIFYIISVFIDAFKIIKNAPDKKIKRLKILFSGFIRGSLFNPKIIIPAKN